MYLVIVIFKRFSSCDGGLYLKVSIRCPGAGTGDRGAQPEKLGNILHAPVWISQSKGATSLDLNAPANPLAPELTCRGCGSHSKKKQFPPPYSPSVQPDTTTLKSCSKKNKDTVISAPSFKFNHQLTFLQREAGGQYRFSPLIVPASTEPDLQALNNSFVATAKKDQFICGATSVLILSNLHQAYSHLPLEKAKETIVTACPVPTKNGKEKAKPTSTVLEDMGWLRLGGHMTTSSTEKAAKEYDIWRKSVGLPIERGKVRKDCLDLDECKKLPEITMRFRPEWIQRKGCRDKVRSRIGPEDRGKVPEELPETRRSGGAELRPREFLPRPEMDID
ncbi:uncharacterized protein F5147DRAFT_652091 [Suillus discolor]|uniref:Uncharacterized protein n=1 Tax=Suillus discolor TaxID=1912936 RepID=A0A9P7F9K8_9AGAM|nr:uncharacterized protein F5147DRAFT_652091 [Suillus discolor]KAG2109907.1 hypothetical protein F5147DRAFT_652091 [Suillus discolor]